MGKEVRTCALEGCDETFVAKSCSTCLTIKCPCEFNKDKSTKDGLCYQCRECQRIYHREWRKKNDANMHSKASRYGLGFEKLKSMMEDRAGRCDACDLVVDTLYIDHDHSCCPGKFACGKCVRGLLCMGCNMALGSVNDNIGRLDALMVYLEKWQKR